MRMFFVNPPLISLLERNQNFNVGVCVTPLYFNCIRYCNFPFPTSLDIIDINIAHLINQENTTSRGYESKFLVDSIAQIVLCTILGSRSHEVVTSAFRIEVHQ